MNVKTESLKPYFVNGVEFIPLYQWDKVNQDGKPLGKTPTIDEWPKKRFQKDAYKTWLKKGRNLGYRIKEHELIIDIDPRAFKKGVDSLQLLAETFGYFDFDELIEEERVVKTGGGGWHIYCTLPKSVDFHLLKERIDAYPGVEFKKKGKQVVAAGSKHPSGNYYEWLHICDPQEVPEKLLTLLKRDKKTSQGAKYGLIDGVQLEQMVLSQLDVTDFRSNDTWFPILAASHHVTGGNGLEAFLRWSTSDSEYENDENRIISRWDSLGDESKNPYTGGQLLKAISEAGGDTSLLSAIIDFSEFKEQKAVEEEVFNPTEKHLFDQADGLSQRLSDGEGLTEDESEFLEDIGFDPNEDERRPYREKVFEAIETLSKDSTPEELDKVIGIVANADAYTIEEAKGLIVSNTRLKLQFVKSQIKEKQNDDANEDLAAFFAKKTLDEVFNKGRHIMNTPEGILYAYVKTHWIKINSDLLGKLVRRVFKKMQPKLKGKGKINENSLTVQAVSLIKMDASTVSNRLFSGEEAKSIINCLNGELHINGRTGEHRLEEHSYKSYLTSCLNVNYDPTATAPLFMKTVNEIFSNFKDSEQMVKHLGEVCGYTIQPVKNIAAWWLFKGPGGDGKSTIINLLGAILKETQLNTSVKILSVGGANSYAHGVNSLVGKLSVIIEEIPSHHLFDDAGLKNLSANKGMEANPKGKDTFNFTYCASLIMCSNTFPSIRDVSSGTYRRANVIPFNAQFVKRNKADINREADIINDPVEMSGMLNFFLEGLQRLRDRGRFNPPPSCRKATEDWQLQSNNLFRFASECIVRVESIKPPLIGKQSEIFEVYRHWCEYEGIQERSRLGTQNFASGLVDLGFIHKKSGGDMRFYGGRLDGRKIRDFDGMGD